MTPSDIAREIAALKHEIAKVIVGQRDVVDGVIAGLLAEGHVLLEGAPGLGKTLLVKTLAECTSLQFSRIQFTPDLMPSDVTGTTILVTDPEERRRGLTFTVQKGPVFAQLLLADEINRATPKTQSALLEAMGERSVTLAGHKHALEPPFLVLATENPIEMEGTFPLPEAQLDRFLLKILVPNPTEDELCDVLSRTTSTARAAVTAIVTADHVRAWCAACRAVTAAPEILRFAARLVHATDPENRAAPALAKRAVRFGAGVRAAQALVLAGKAMALQDGRGHVAFDDLLRVAKPVLRHRLVRTFEGEAEGITTDHVIEDVCAAVPKRSPDVEAKLKESAA